ncbi:MAG: hypothetical protein IJV35_01950 [Neisseriaceae bacterium]|nr:hypothetical protein [Neisseriaceae bacterium]
MKMKKIAVLNYSGNVGKTTIVNEVLQPNLPDYEIITIDSVNVSGKEKIVFRGADTDKIFTELLVQENAILDIGSSNLEQYFESSNEAQELLEYIDTFIVPIVPAIKQQNDSIKTIKDLIKFGIDPQKIFVVANIVDKGEKAIFDDIFAALKKLSVNVCQTQIPKHELYQNGGSIAKRAADNTDYAALIEDARQKGDSEKLRKYSNKFVVQRRVMRLNDIFVALFNEIVH